CGGAGGHAGGGCLGPALFLPGGCGARRVCVVALLPPRAGSRRGVERDLRARVRAVRCPPAPPGSRRLAELCVSNCCALWRERRAALVRAALISGAPVVIAPWPRLRGWPGGGNSVLSGGRICRFRATSRGGGERFPMWPA